MACNCAAISKRTSTPVRNAAAVFAQLFEDIAMPELADAIVVD
jgi:hypothetical protein